MAVHRMEYADERSSVFVREMRFDFAGDSVDYHEHAFPHLLYLPAGSALVERQKGSERTQTKLHASRGLAWCLIEAGEIHKVTALEPDTIGHCIYAHRTPQGEVTQTWTGWRRAYG